MKLKTLPILMAVAAPAILLNACDVDVEKKGKLPKVNVDVEKGELPEVEVRGPKVEVGEKKIELPDSVTVPTIDVKVPKENDG